MAERLTDKILKELNLKVGEMFEIQGVKDHTFCIGDDFYVKCFEGNVQTYNVDYTWEYDLQYLLFNPEKIVKLPQQGPCIPENKKLELEVIDSEEDPNLLYGVVNKPFGNLNGIVIDHGADVVFPCSSCGGYTTMQACESMCQRYQSCDTVAIANDILVDFEKQIAVD